MDTIWENSSLKSVQKLVTLAGLAIGRHDRGPHDPEDSGIDSDDPGPALPPRAALSLQLFEDDLSGDEPYEDLDESCPAHDLMSSDTNYLDMLAVKDGDFHKLRGLRPLEEEPQSNRSSPLLFEVELTASDEDDDASVLELVIPMQSRYQRVPTSSPKKTNAKPPLWMMLLCCTRK